MRVEGDFAQSVTENGASECGRRASAGVARLRRAVVLFAAGGLLTTLAGAQQAPSARKLLVVVIAVSEIEDATLHNATLATSIAQRADSIRDYFSHNYDPNTVEIRVLRSRQETTYDYIKAFLRGELRQLGAGTVTLMFVLSHGKPTSRKQGNLRQDLMIATSNTTDANWPNRALFANGDLIEDLQGLTAGSVVLLFLDTCYSGAAIDGLLPKFQAAVLQERGLRMMVLASTLSDREAFRASFTEGLLTLWRVRRSACTEIQSAPDEIRRIMDSTSVARYGEHLRPGDGHPRVLIPYLGRLCLEAFGAETGVLFLLNPTATSRTATVRALADRTARAEFTDRAMEPKDVLPLRLTRDRYEVSISSEDLVVRTDTVDLASGFAVDIVPGVGGEDLEVLGAQYQRAANLAAFAFGNENARVDLLTHAYVASSASNQSRARERARTIRDGLEAQGRTDVFAARTFWTGEHSVPTDTGWEWHTAVLSQQYDAVASVLEKMAAEASSTKERKARATRAYLSYAASSRPAKAKELQEKYALDVVEVCAQCGVLTLKALRAPDEVSRARAREELRRASVAALLSDVKVP